MNSCEKNGVIFCKYLTILSFCEKKKHKVNESLKVIHTDLQKLNVQKFIFKYMVYMNIHT